MSDFTMAVNGSIIDSENRLQQLEKDCSGNMQEYFDEILKKLGREVLLPDNNDLTNTIDKYWCVAELQTELPQDSLAALSFKAALLNYEKLLQSSKERFSELYEQLNEIQQKYKDSKEYNMLRANVTIDRIRCISFFSNTDKEEKNAVIKDFINWWVDDCPFYPDVDYSEVDKKAAEILLSYLDCRFNISDDIAEKKTLVDKLSEKSQTDRCPETLKAARDMRQRACSSTRISYST